MVEAGVDLKRTLTEGQPHGGAGDVIVVAHAAPIHSGEVGRGDRDGGESFTFAGVLLAVEDRGSDVPVV
jgi:hypothetical protein